RLLAAAIASALALSLTACSGGGGGANVRPSNPPPPSTTPSPPPPTTVYSYPAYNHLVPTGALTAQQAGYTGKGVNVGILDSGVDPNLADMQGRITWFQGYGPNNTLTTTTPSDPVGHGSVVAQILGGSAADGFPGGVAPDSSLYIAQVCVPNGSTGQCTSYSRA
ncbi:peptidase S8 family protein, partial [mine drainage metagenome]